MLTALRLRDEDQAEADESLEELGALIETLDGTIVGRVLQVREAPEPALCFGRGKVDELKALVPAERITVVAHDGYLTPTQNRNLEKALGLRVLDRTEVILEIFANHARTRMSKTQVEIARLQFSLTRLARRWTHLERQRGGGVTMRGVGEKQIELDRRSIKDRISRLTRELEDIDRVARTKRKRRAELPKVALVGYTNVGKSTLLNALTGAETLVVDKLFATLEASVKVMRYGERPAILITDTVGFIRKLPTSLIASFRSTLDEVNEADLLLHVLDLSHPAFERQRIDTDAVLAELGALDKPTIYVGNKVDRLGDRSVTNYLERIYPGYVLTSSLTGEGIETLKTRIYEHFEQRFQRERLVFSYLELGLLDELRKVAKIERIEYEGDRVLVEVVADERVLAQVRARVGRGSAEYLPDTVLEVREPPNDQP